MSLLNRGPNTEKPRPHKKNPEKGAGRKPDKSPPGWSKASRAKRAASSAPNPQKKTEDRARLAGEPKPGAGAKIQSASPVEVLRELSIIYYKLNSRKIKITVYSLIPLFSYSRKPQKKTG
jgi:hypothetical protein